MLLDLVITQLVRERAWPEAGPRSATSLAASHSRASQLSPTQQFKDGPHCSPAVWQVTPLPLRDTICGLSAALSVIESVPVELPVVLGAKVTLIVGGGGVDDPLLPPPPPHAMRRHKERVSTTRKNRFMMLPQRRHRLYTGRIPHGFRPYYCSEACARFGCSLSKPPPLVPQARDSLSSSIPLRCRWEQVQRSRPYSGNHQTDAALPPQSPTRNWACM